jgi:hypothetical protein
LSVREHCEVADHLRNVRFEFRTRDEAAAVGHTLVQLLPRVAYLEFMLLELMINAVEHGNLEIGSRLKAELIRDNALDAEIEARLARAPYRYRSAALVMQRTADRINFSISDEGPGFDWRAIAMPDPGARSGRGLALAQAMCPDGLRFNETGNVVTLSVPWEVECTSASASSSSRTTRSSPSRSRARSPRTR